MTDGWTPARLRRFRTALASWYRRASRPLPWRENSDPYRIWVSEIMLQQTRAQAVIPYYRKFLERFPDPAALACAPEHEVLECWSGLGYYSRARNLRRAAQQITSNGAFPRDYDAVRALPGVGDYTAAAVASIAFGLPHSAVDGNVLRVLARLRNDPSEISAGQTRKLLREAATELLDRRDPGQFNQAMMELGATICIPKRPRCAECPVEAYCGAREAGTQNQLPVKLRRADVNRVELTLALIERGGRALMFRREAGARRMAGFWELPEPEQVPGFRRTADVGHFRHAITHNDYRIRVVRGTARCAPAGFRWLSPAVRSSLPLSTIARKALALASKILPPG